MRFLGLFGFLALATAMAGESAILASGARLHADGHEIEGARVRLYNGNGFIEMDTALVMLFEADDPPPAAPAPAPAPPAPAVQPPPSPQDLADVAADRYGLPRRLVRSVMSAESGFQPAAVSPEGAIGLMQLMPGTARDLGVDPRDPAQNVDGGTRYLRDLLVRYDGLLWHALAAYNAGPGAVNKSKDGLPPYRETIRYVNRIDKAFRQPAAQADSDGTR
ncbi:MAG TPA: lytic transglycosylase domain-containing protein [Bryobacteraceae bacterium]|nr:lytic transglycosylase domain-containing protein [Bryobacteraceae bacterium]